MAIQANPQDQKIQSVLHAMGYDLGKHGVDGSKGDDTKFAMRQFALSHGVSIHEMAAVQQAILDKLKDPSFRERTLDYLKTLPQTRDNVVATKWVLEAAGHSTSGMKDQIGLMTAKMDKSAQYALEHTVNGQVDATVVASAVGAGNTQTRDTILASKGILPEPSKAFAGAVEGQKLAQAGPVAPVVAPRLER